MSKQSEREKFFATMATEGLPYEVAKLVARNAATIQRLSEAECNGDYPCDNGERKVSFCERCESGYVPSSLVARKVPDGSIKYLCPNCRAQDRIVALLSPYAVKADFQGDPRGACVKLVVPSGKTDDWGRTGICVPA